MSFVAPSLVKSFLTATRYTKIHQKFIRRKMRSSLERIDFFIDEPNSLRNIQIFKKNSVKYREQIYLSKPYEFDSLTAKEKINVSPSIGSGKGQYAK